MHQIMTQEPIRFRLSPEEEARQIRAARLDPQAFGGLYDRYAPSIYRYLMSRLGNVEEARDVTSQTFLAAFERFPRYRHNGFFSAWLFSIARSKFVDHLRKAANRTEKLPDGHPDQRVDLLQQVVESERVSELKRLISSLTDDEQELLRLRFVAELSFGEMAALLQRNEEAVKKSVYRLLARLQSQLEA
jgi:RNA polymerase sigma-70 factor (ECF subfamily)